MGRLISYIIFLFAFFTLIYFKLTYSGTNDICRITIIPTFLPSNLDTKQSIIIVKNVDPDSYAYLCANIKYINKSANCGKYDYGCFTPGGRVDTIYIGNDETNPILEAASIVHQICHVKQLVDGKSLLEKECSYAANLFLQKAIIY